MKRIRKPMGLKGNRLMYSVKGKVFIVVYADGCAARIELYVYTQAVHKQFWDVHGWKGV